MNKKKSKEKPNKKLFKKKFNYMLKNNIISQMNKNSKSEEKLKKPKLDLQTMIIEFKK
jgi:hypothetical protein